MNRRGFLARCIGAAVAMAAAPLEPLLPRAVNQKFKEFARLPVLDLRTMPLPIVMYNFVWEPRRGLVQT